jgi:antitoxin (DNA-binding transcriptional repressor) of toxin-antitoxin stability system
VGAYSAPLRQRVRILAQEIERGGFLCAEFRWRHDLLGRRRRWDFGEQLDVVVALEAGARWDRWFRGVRVMYNAVMVKNVIRFPESEAAKTNVEELLVHVRSGAEVVIENGARPVAVLRSAESHPGRLLSESISMARAHGSTVTLDGDFGRDLETIVHSHLESLDPPPWD